MQDCFIRVALLLCLCCAVTACSRKPDNQSVANIPGNPATDNSNNTNAAPGAPDVNLPPASQPEVSQPVVVPAGTGLTVRLGEDLGSKISQTGQRFSATLARAVRVGEEAVIPAGARVSGTVEDAEPLGRFAGGATLCLRLNSITVHGAEKGIETSSLTRVEKGKGKRTGAMIGGGAGLGAIIGGIAGGGKGAAIGALAGGGAGTAGTALTGNKNIVLPAESLLTFKLERSLKIQ